MNKKEILQQWIADNYHRVPDVDLHYYLFDNKLPSSIDDLMATIEDDGGFNIDVIYYSKAIAYLADNDPSFRESLALAADMGYNTDDLSSEILASLLASEQVRTDFNNIYSELGELIDQLNELE